MSENRGRPKENVERKMKYVIEYGDLRWHYDLNKYPNGPYLVEQLDETYNELERLFKKLEKFSIVIIFLFMIKSKKLSEIVFCIKLFTSMYHSNKNRQLKIFPKQ